jgi:hypothetical protein
MKIQSERRRDHLQIVSASSSSSSSSWHEAACDDGEDGSFVHNPLVWMTLCITLYLVQFAFLASFSFSISYGTNLDVNHLLLVWCGSCRCERNTKKWEEMDASAGPNNVMKCILPEGDGVRNMASDQMVLAVLKVGIVILVVVVRVTSGPSIRQFTRPRAYGFYTHMH